MQTAGGQDRLFRDTVDDGMPAGGENPVRLPTVPVGRGRFEDALGSSAAPCQEFSVFERLRLAPGFERVLECRQSRLPLTAKESMAGQGVTSGLTFLTFRALVRAFCVICSRRAGV